MSKLPINFSDGVTLEWLDLIVVDPLYYFGSSIKQTNLMKNHNFSENFQKVVSQTRHCIVASNICFCLRFAECAVCWAITTIS